MEYLYKKLRAGRWGGVDVVGFYEAKSGVLSGQTVRQYLDTYPDEETARKAHPEATSYTNRFIDPEPNLSHLPDENDPVPGGMYPDDI